jgi:hypothetical protein
MPFIRQVYSIQTTILHHHPNMGRALRYIITIADHDRWLLQKLCQKAASLQTPIATGLVVLAI